MTEKDLKIQDLTKKLKTAESKLDYIKNFIEENCIYDNHLQGYCFDLPKGKVRTLMYTIKDNNKE